MASNDWLKMTVHDAAGMNRHNGRDERVNGNHENKFIDKSKSYLNLYIGCDDYSKAYEAMRERVKEVDALYPPKRKNKPAERIICCMIEIPCPQEIVDRGYEETERFFQGVYGIYQDFFGEKNVHGGFVHFDEVHEYTDKDGTKRMSLPHMHCLVSAYSEWTEKNKKTGELTERKGINGKHFETRVRMKRLNELVENFCNQKFGVRFMTGETPQRKSVETLKAEEEVHQMTAQKKQIQADIDTLQHTHTSTQVSLEKLTEEKRGLVRAIGELKGEEFQIHNAISDLQALQQEMKCEFDKKKAELSLLENSVLAKEEENEVLQKKIDELQQQVLSITIPEPPVYPQKPTIPRPQQSKEMYVKVMTEDIPYKNIFDRKKDEKKFKAKYEEILHDWSEYDKAVEQYNLDYAKWAENTKTLKALQEHLRTVSYYQRRLEEGERILYSNRELEQGKEIKKLQTENEELHQQNQKLQSDLEAVMQQVQSLADVEYQRKRKRDAEIIEAYQAYSGIAPDEIEIAVMEQEKQNFLSYQDYNSD